MAPKWCLLLDAVDSHLKSCCVSLTPPINVQSPWSAVRALPFVLIRPLCLSYETLKSSRGRLGSLLVQQPAKPLGRLVFRSVCVKNMSGWCESRNEKYCFVYLKNMGLKSCLAWHLVWREMSQQGNRIKLSTDDCLVVMSLKDIHEINFTYHIYEQGWQTDAWEFVFCSYRECSYAGSGTTLS